MRSRTPGISSRGVAWLLNLLFVAPLCAQGTQAGDQERVDRFAKQMTGVALRGSYTDDSGRSHEDRYDIEEAKPVGDGELWVFKARIRYGDLDVTLPVPLQVKWVGQTPVIALDQVTLPGLGTFSAFVIIDGDRYAGTWRHDGKGGHMFGTLERQGSKAEAAETDESQALSTKG